MPLMPPEELRTERPRLRRPVPADALCYSRVR